MVIIIKNRTNLQEIANFIIPPSAPLTIPVAPKTRRGGLDMSATIGPGHIRETPTPRSQISVARLLKNPWRACLVA
eukprot:scaffold101956_cov33-Prasinocladus_malaysianus.AAC.1